MIIPLRKPSSISVHCNEIDAEEFAALCRFRGAPVGSKVTKIAIKINKSSEKKVILLNLLVATRRRTVISYQECFKKWKVADIQFPMPLSYYGR